jgi:hypothetical protein
MRTRSAVVLAFALAAAPWSDACVVLGLRHEVAFTDDGRSLQSSSVRSVADWYVELRDGQLGIAGISVSAYSIKGNPVSADRVKARVAAVTELLTTLGMPDPVPLTSSVVPIERIGVEQYPQVRISVQPKCAATHSCCGTDPNLK